MPRQITHIVIHCTATPQNTTVASIQRYWRNVLGWKSPGYHVIILPNGTTQQLSSYDNATNGVAGHNKHSIHISYIGGVNAANVPVDNRTPAQRATMLRLVTELKEQYPNAIVCGHRDFPKVKKACPSFSVAAWLKEMGFDPKN